MKRFNLISDCTRSKRPRLVEPLSYSIKKSYISASSLYNYMIKDTLVDWLKIKYSKNNNIPIITSQQPKKATFTEFIMKRGIEFEHELVQYINNNILPVISISNTIDDNSIQLTKESMLKGIPIIHSAPLRDNKTCTQGIADLLIRSDYINQLIDEPVLTDEEINITAPKLNGNYHYIVIDIKFSTLPLRADGKHILNSGSYPAYKAQCLVYTNIISSIQGYTSPYAFIMGRRWRTNECGRTKHNYTCFNRLGKIDYSGVDKNYLQETKNAIKWISDLRKNGHKWSVNPPSRTELYPNMCVDSGYWNKEKEIIANQIGEITNIWYLGIKHRNTSINKGITTWKNPLCTTELMNFRGVRAPIVDAILNINRQNKDKIRPKKIESNMFDWKNPNKNELYVDFETLSDIFSDFKHLPEQSCTDMIFMIGIGWDDNGSWKFKNFICKHPTYDEEYRIMNEFITFITGFINPTLYHWYAEKSFWYTAECRQFDIACENDDHDKKENISNNWNKIKWADLCTLFRSEPIVIKDCFKFSLKNIAKAMKKHGMINTSLETNCDSGLTAMINAWKVYQDSNDPLNSSVMKDIAEYNQFDTKVLWEILGYLRKYHK